MKISEHTVLIINHCHTPTGELDHYFGSNKQYVLQNPLYRSCFELFLSYVPIFSTFTGVRALLGIANIENVFGSFQQKVTVQYAPLDLVWILMKLCPRSAKMLG